jgi:uncharacterized membrane protein
MLRNAAFSFLTGILFGLGIGLFITAIATHHEDPRIRMLRKYIQIERLQGEIVELAQ